MSKRTYVKKLALEHIKQGHRVLMLSYSNVSVDGQQFWCCYFWWGKYGIYSPNCFSASLAGQHFICMGDFRQLPPIVQSNANPLLNTDIFQYCGITAAVDSRRNHKWLCMLNTQYRMHPQIADFANRTMYKGLLSSTDNMAGDRQQIVKAKPIPDHAMARDIAEAAPELNPISCATVHQFQGSEKDVIIYDVVDCYE